MALPHARPLDIIAADPAGANASTSLLKTARLQLLHMLLPAGREQPQHHVDDESVVHCLHGEIDVAMPDGSRRLRAGELVVLPARQRHALRALSDSAVLVTLLLRDGDAGDGGGAGNRTL